MPKKISIWTAAGQFFNMINRNSKKYEKRTNLKKNQNRFVLKKFEKSEIDNESSYQIDSKSEILTPNSLKIVPFVESHSPMMTSVESKKINKITEEMIDFWNLMTLNEKFMESFVTESFPSIFEKFSNYFSEKTDIESGFESEICSINHKIKCLCFGCWKKRRINIQNSNILFSTSPIDSLEVYKKSRKNKKSNENGFDSGIEADSEPDFNSYQSPISSSPVFIPILHQNRIKVEIEKTQKSEILEVEKNENAKKKNDEQLENKIRIQAEIIEKLIELNKLFL